MPLLIPSVMSVTPDAVPSGPLPPANVTPTSSCGSNSRSPLNWTKPPSDTSTLPPPSSIDPVTAPKVSNESESPCVPPTTFSVPVKSTSGPPAGRSVPAFRPSKLQTLSTSGAVRVSSPSLPSKTIGPVMIPPA